MKIKDMIREIVITTILETEIDVTVKATIKLQTDNIKELEKELENKKTKIEKLVLKILSTPLKFIYKDKPIKVIIAPEIHLKDYNLDLTKLD